ncbi:mitochondrial 37S ribosomal protein uS11m [Aspergillus undulatus]|uniref:mitochondrial 37S ribosomal protein uS11m n=1 Tax=Aspergillus undulatus TaxID=1810928 RepID=UPI003CCCADC9
MNNTFAHSLARALPSVGRSIQPRASLLHSRLFSSTPKTLQSRPEDSLGSNIPGARSDGLANDLSSSSFTGELERETRGRMSNDYAAFAQQIEEDMLTARLGANSSPPYHIHVLSHKHNTVMTLTRPNGSPLMSMGTGVLGFRKARRGGYDPAFQLSAHLFAQIQERGLLLDIKNIEIIFRGFHQGRMAFTKALLGKEGQNIRGLVSRVADSTRIKFGGTRSPRVRRL